MPARLPALLAAPAAGATPLWLTNARVLDGTGAAPREGVSVLVSDGRIAAITGAAEQPPAGSSTVDLEGRTLMPGLIDAHAHIYAKLPEPAGGAEPLLPGTEAHVVAAHLREALRMGVTTMRDVGSYGRTVVEARQAMRLGAFRGPRLLTCGRIVSATSPGGRFFDGMYREADGADDVRRAVREQLRHGADFVKVMTTGARSVELEDPDPAQMTPAEVATLVEEAHRLGYRAAAHAEGLAGTEIAVAAGIDTIEHGMYLNQSPDLLDRMAEQGQVLVPTLSCFYGVAGLDEHGGHAPATWSPLLVELAHHNLDEAGRTLTAARGPRRGREDRARPRLAPFLQQRGRARAHGSSRPPGDGGARRRDRDRRSGARPRRRARDGAAGQDRRPAGRRRRPSLRPRGCCAGGSGSGSSSSSARRLQGPLSKPSCPARPSHRPGTRPPWRTRCGGSIARSGARS